MGDKRLQEAKQAFNLPHLPCQSKRVLRGEQNNIHLSLWQRMFSTTTLYIQSLFHVEGGVNVSFPPGMLNTDFAIARRCTQKVCKTFCCASPSTPRRGRRGRAFTRREKTLCNSYFPVFYESLKKRGEGGEEEVLGGEGEGSSLLPLKKKKLHNEILSLATAS